LIGLVIMAIFPTDLQGAPYGLANRLFVSVLIVWLLAISIRLRRIGAPVRDGDGAAP
jgi:hypothetical protein